MCAIIQRETVGVVGRCTAGHSQIMICALAIGGQEGDSHSSILTNVTKGIKTEALIPGASTGRAGDAAQIVMAVGAGLGVRAINLIGDCETSQRTVGVPRQVSGYRLGG